MCHRFAIFLRRIALVRAPACRDRSVQCRPWAPWLRRAAPERQGNDIAAHFAGGFGMTGGQSVAGRRRTDWRGIGRLALQSLITGLVASLALAGAVFLMSFEARAAGAGDAMQGTLLLREASGANAEAPLLFTDVHITVTGMLARIDVRQRFVNPTSAWREGVYVFPLPESAAVDHLTMHIGERAIEGQIRERTEARRAYDTANAEGRKATLLEQERPNMFTTNVANIGPDEEIEVALEYQQTLRYDEGSFSLRFPLALTPRYIPGSETATAALAQPVADADRIAPPFADPRDGYVNPVTITVDLDAGFPLAKLASSYHPIDIEEIPGNRYRMTLDGGAVPANRDFELVWTPEVGSAPGAAIFTETKGDRTYALVMVLPATAPDTSAPRPPREVIFVVDTSGSMEGVSIKQAREAMLLALGRLQGGDRFNVIEFNSTTRALFSAPMPFDATTLRQATRFVEGLRAGGGTEMLPALAKALEGDAASPMLRQVVFLTDGAVGNEDPILKLVHERLGDRRLFTIGIGPAPNTFFLTRAAQFGRGSFTFIGDVREVKEKMSALFRKLERPAITDIAIAWPGAADAWPRIVPDLYTGEPVIATAQFPAGALPGAVRLRGRRSDADWDASLPIDASASDAGVGVVWARAKIAALMDAGRRGAPEAEIREAVVDIALTHHLVSKYTSLVAVDVTPTRPGGVDASKTALPGNVPEGLTGFDRLPRTATSANASLLLGIALLLAAAMAAGLARRHARQMT
jgi:Ca-activated chloride channel family protein